MTHQEATEHAKLESHHHGKSVSVVKLTDGTYTTAWANSNLPAGATRCETATYADDRDLVGYLLAARSGK